MISSKKIENESKKIKLATSGCDRKKYFVIEKTLRLILIGDRRIWPRTFFDQTFYGGKMPPRKNLIGLIGTPKAFEKTTFGDSWKNTKIAAENFGNKPIMNKFHNK